MQIRHPRHPSGPRRRVTTHRRSHLRRRSRPDLGGVVVVGSQEQADDHADEHDQREHDEGERAARGWRGAYPVGHGARGGGLEPPTTGSKGRRSAQLNYPRSGTAQVTAWGSWNFSFTLRPPFRPLVGWCRMRRWRPTLGSSGCGQAYEPVRARAAAGRRARLQRLPGLAPVAATSPSGACCVTRTRFARRPRRSSDGTLALLRGVPVAWLPSWVH